MRLTDGLLRAGRKSGFLLALTSGAQVICHQILSANADTVLALSPASGRRRWPPKKPKDGECGVCQVAALQLHSGLALCMQKRKPGASSALIYCWGQVAGCISQWIAFKLVRKKIFSANGCHVGNVPHVGGELSAQPEVTPMSSIWCFLGSIPAGKRGWGHPWRSPHAGSGSPQWSPVAGAHHARQVVQQVFPEGLPCAILSAHGRSTEQALEVLLHKSTLAAVFGHYS